MNNIIKTKAIKILEILVITLVLVTTLNVFSVKASTTVEPADNQYFEMRATTITDIPDQGKQLIMELWGYNIDFKRI